MPGNPAAYGLSNVTEKSYAPLDDEIPPFASGSIVGNPGEYLNWDSTHGTTTFNALIAGAADYACWEVELGREMTDFSAAGQSLEKASWP